MRSALSVCKFMRSTSHSLPFFRLTTRAVPPLLPPRSPARFTRVELLRESSVHAGCLSRQLRVSYPPVGEIGETRDFFLCPSLSLRLPCLRADRNPRSRHEGSSPGLSRRSPRAQQETSRRGTAAEREITKAGRAGFTTECALAKREGKLSSGLN